MRVLQVSSDRSKRGVLYPRSPALKRQEAYASNFGNLDIIGFSRVSDGAQARPGEHLTIAPTNSTSPWHYGFDALRVAKTLQKPDVVTVQDPFETGLVGLLIACRFKAPLHVQVHTDFLASPYVKHSLVNRARALIARFVLKRASRVRVVSSNVRGKMAKFSQVPITVLPIFVDLEKIQNAQAASNLAAKFQRFSTKLLVVGRLEPEKNFPLAIDAFSKAAPKNTCLIIVGEGSERSQLENQAKECGVSDRVFFEGERSGIEYYPLADLVLVTSRYEGYGLVIVEALAAGKPVLSTDVGAAREAGAIVSSERDFAADLKRWFENGPRTAELQGYPYKNFDEYVRAYCDDIRACTTGGLSL